MTEGLRVPEPEAPGLELVGPGLALAASLATAACLLLAAPLGYDEFEFVRAARWVAEGRLPYRDFWEHHTPLFFYVLAPLAACLRADRLSDLLALRAAVAISWGATLVLMFRLLFRRGAPAPVVLLAAALFMGSGQLGRKIVEVRPDGPMNLLYVGALVLLEANLARSSSPGRPFLAGLLLGLASLTSLRMAPVAAATVLLYLAVRSEGTWGIRRDVSWAAWGALAAALAAVGFWGFHGALGQLLEQTVRVNAAYEPASVPASFRLSFGQALAGVPFSDRDAPLLLLSAAAVAAFVRVCRRGLAPSLPLRLALLGAVQLVSVARMPQPYPYHFLGFWLLAAASGTLWAGEAWSGRLRLSVGIASLAAVAATTSVLTRLPWPAFSEMQAYQDHVRRRIHEVTLPTEKVWDGVGYVFDREPAHPIWFQPGLVIVLTRDGLLPRASPESLARARPAALVLSVRSLRYVEIASPGLGPFLGSHYLPLEPALWVPALSGRLAPGAARTWTVLRDGLYRVVTAPRLLGSPWFEHPLGFALVSGPPERSRLDVAALSPPDAGGGLDLEVDGAPWRAGGDGTIRLRAGQAVTASNHGSQPLVILVVPVEHAVFFDVPFPGLYWDASL